MSNFQRSFDDLTPWQNAVYLDLELDLYLRTTTPVSICYVKVA